MRLKSLPKELFAEVLDYLADFEHLHGLNEILDGEHTILDARSALHEAAIQLRKQIASEKDEKNITDYRKDTRLSEQVRNLLSILSPGDERKLLDRFGFLDS
jgi:flagellar biosynthesis/type III secretory pathway chaperone